MSNRIHPTAVVAASVRLGSGNTIGPFAVITGDVWLDDDNWIGAGVVIGATPEIRSLPHTEDGMGSGRGVRIGSGNVLREYAQVHAGSEQPTTIGDGGFIMNQVYVAHDCHLGDGVTLASSVLLAGHVQVGANANLGLGTAVHQRTVIGEGAMVGMSAAVTRDVPAFAKAYGNPARVRGANVVGSTRLGASREAAEALDRAYSGGDLAAADELVRRIRDEIAASS